MLTSRKHHFHQKHGKLATITSVQPPGRYGAIECSSNEVVGSQKAKRRWRVNKRWFCPVAKVLDHIASDETSWESEPLSNLATMGSQWRLHKVLATYGYHA